MAKLLKLDLHTHPIEALKEKMGIKGILDINREVVSAIINAIKSAGLNGIAITECNNFNYGWVTSLEIMEQFSHENLLILPGVEINNNGQQFLQIYVPDRYRRRIPFFKGKEWFLILTNPTYYNPLDIENTRQMEFDAVEEKSLPGEFSLVKQISQEMCLPISLSSGAHRLEDVGLRYMELELK